MCSVRSRAPSRNRAALYARNALSIRSAALSLPVIAAGSMRGPVMWGLGLRGEDIEALRGSGRYVRRSDTIACASRERHAASRVLDRTWSLGSDRTSRCRATPSGCTPACSRPPLKPCSSRPRQAPPDSGSDVAVGRSRGAFAPDPLQGGIPMRPLTFACTSLAALALLSAPRSAPAATPEVITLSPGDTQATWQTPLIVGNTGEDPNNCIE